MMKNSNSTETMASETGLPTERPIPETRAEIEQKQRVSREDYLQYSLKLKQMEVHSQIE